jgi:diaminopimelate epimerase
MRFTKMHGIGNDYIYVNGFEQTLKDPAETARRVSDRHYGVGGDGLILILPSDKADVRMQMFNADGSEGMMCGNGIRCVAKYAYEHNLARKNPIAVETASGIKQIALEIESDHRVRAARVDMGEPILDAGQIPTRFDGERVLDRPLGILGEMLQVTCVSMGNPHAIVFVDDAAAFDLERIGPAVETHEAFPDRTNLHVVQVHSHEELTMRTWERGSGVTLACGTGASAVVVAGAMTDRCGRKATVHLPGGDLLIEWAQEDNHVYMTGSAEEVFTGDWPGEE